MKLTEDYCSYDVAKLLKEKGFDEVWDHYIEDTTPPYKSGKMSDLICDYMYPTHQMAMKWLREEKNLFIDISFINHYTKDEILHTGWCFAVFHLNNFDEPYYKDIEYSTYEQAVEAALKYSLENLI